MSAKLRHPSYKAYKQGCRCDGCRERQNRRVAANRAKRLQELHASPADPRHGTRNGYDCGCRCRKCRDARSGAYRENEARQAVTA